MALYFEWDESKAKQNFTKHRVTFDEAESIFSDPRSFDHSDPDHSWDEDRWIKIGISKRGRLLVAAYTERTHRIRIISARRANRLERLNYEEGT